MELIIIKDTTVESINGVRVGCGNFYIDKYTLPDKSVKEGQTAQLFFLDTEREITVGIGSRFDINGKSYEVIKFDKGKKGMALLCIKEI